MGGNQHKSVPIKDFKKTSYPLPRDIASRKLANIGPKALPKLISVLEGNNNRQLSEVIDAVGFICFYNYQKEVFQILIECHNRSGKNELIKWKLFRAMSAFPESRQFLLKEKAKIENEGLRREIDRSLFLIEKRVKKENLPEHHLA
ncbi:hypothetical protein [Xanthovirga aplysinae]|uniref:hypothetical protein n=1 Tax=Xanthovirga aplysinae TaxID=2529853 RepID=UPI0012BCB80B|nr:hypothetical protein [Xanthovirga aplysinae]MTI31137.1 hypothetical protein [Xanthovirga aplysinae]